MVNLYVPQIVGFSLRNKPGAVIASFLIIATIMRAVARWYDLDIIYKSDIPHRNFSISLPRSASLEDLLDILRKQGGDFVRDGKTIVELK